MKKLIITADDYGMCEDVNRAIKECAKARVVLSTNVMTNMPCCEDAAYLKEKIPGLSVGLHYNFTVGTPLSPLDKVSTLVDSNGIFLPYRKIREACKNKAYDYEQVKTEMTAQYERYVEICGEPDYWNTHENVHVYPDMYSLFRDVSLGFGIKRMRSHQRIFIPSSTGKSDKSLKWTLTNPIKCVMLDQWQSGSAKLGVTAPDGILVRLNENDKLDLPYLFKEIKWRKNEIAEMAIHPSLSGNCEHFGEITQLRVKEYGIFSNPEVIKIAADNGIEISNFDF